MAYDEGLAQRIRDSLPRGVVLEEKKMFGGLCFLDRGNMACGIVRDELMLRLDNDLASAALTEPHTRPMDFTKKPIKSMLFVEAEGIADDNQLREWVGRALAFTATLPAK